MVPTGSNASDGNTESKTTSSAKRVSPKIRYCFTFNNYIEDTVPRFQVMLKKICKKFVFQREVGESGTPHLQGAIWLIKKLRITQLKLIFSTWSEIHWEEMRNEQASLEYCQKGETSIGEPIMYGFPPKLEIYEDPLPWWDELLDIIKHKPEKRYLRWIWDEPGCSGKTEFIKYCSVRFEKECIFANAGSSKDIANLLKNYDEKHGIMNLRYFIYNVARNAPISYNMIEGVKDGIMTNTKYEATSLIFNTPHVIIMSNELPVLESLSLDRWIIYKIKDGYLDYVIEDPEDESDDEDGGA